MNITVYSYKPQGEASRRRPAILLQPVDSHDLEEMEAELAALSSQAACPFVLVPVPVSRWFDQLAPWPAPPVFGKTPFGDGAPATLSLLLRRVLPAVVAANPLNATSEGRVATTVIAVDETKGTKGTKETEDEAEVAEPAEAAPSKAPAATAAPCPVVLGGYSLAGLFALWAGTQHAFSAVVGASPSVWYPHWIAFSESHPMRARAVYLSLGDTEHKSRTPIMATVADCIRRQADIISAQHLTTVLEMNPGNHFKDNGLRMAKGFAWALRAILA